MACVGCSARSPSFQVRAPGSDNSAVFSASRSSPDENLLLQLWNERRDQAANFPIGAGDVLEISAPGIDELKNRTVRVDGNGDIYLPIVGNLKVGGRTEEEARRALDRRLSKVLYHPQADIFVKKYRSRWVAVMGSVRQPGMYVLNGPNDTVRQLIERAGGLTDKAAPRVLLTPGGTRNYSPGGIELASASRSEFGGAAAGLAAGRADGRIDSASQVFTDAEGAREYSTVVLDLQRGSNNFLSLPLRPGDTLYVPIAGSVTVIGWVYHPKTIPITPGLTVLGAVSAAGGPLFAANLDAVKVIREQNNGKSTILSVDLNKVEDHEEPDIRVHANDIIDVSYSAVRLPGYALYYAATGIFSWAPAAVVVGGVP